MRYARIYDKVRFRIERSGMKPKTVYRQVDPGNVGLLGIIPEGYRNDHSSFGGRDIEVTVEYRLHHYVRTAIGPGTVEWLPVRTEVYPYTDNVPSVVITAPAYTAAVSHLRQAVQQTESVLDQLLEAEPKNTTPSGPCGNCGRPTHLAADRRWLHSNVTDGYRCGDILPPTVDTVTLPRETS